MKFTVNRKLLLDALSTAVSVSEKKTTIPILGYCKIEADSEDGSIVITATDMDTGIVLRLFGNVEGEAVTCIHVKNLLAIIAKADSDDTVMDVLKDSVAIQCGAFKSKLQTMDPLNYPAVVTDIEGTVHMIDGAALRKGFGSVDYATMKEGSNYSLRGVKLEANSSAFRAIATEGHVLAVYSSAESLADPVESFLVPSRAVALLKASLPGGPIAVSSDGKTLRFKGENWIFVSRMIEGRFPNWPTMIPKTHEHSILLPRERVLLAVERGRIGLEDDKESKIRLTIKGGLLTVTSKGIGTEIVDEFPIGEDAKDFSCRFNSGFFAPAFRHCESDEIRMVYGADTTVVLEDFTEEKRINVVICGLKD